MRTFTILLIAIASTPLTPSEEVPLAAQYSRSDSTWRPGMGEPPLSVDKAFASAAQIQQTHPGKFPWFLDDVRIPCIPGKGGSLFYSYDFRFSRLIRFDPVEREECTASVDMKSGKVTFSAIKPQK